MQSLLWQQQQQQKKSLCNCVSFCHRLFKIPGLLKSGWVFFSQYFGVRKKARHVLTQGCFGTVVTHWKHSFAWALFKPSLHTVLPVRLWAMSDEIFKLTKARNGHFKSFHFLAISNLHRMTGKKMIPIMKTKLGRLQRLWYISWFTQLQVFIFPPPLSIGTCNTFLNLLLWLVVVPSAMYVCKSL